MEERFPDFEVYVSELQRFAAALAGVGGAFAVGAMMEGAAALLTQLGENAPPHSRRETDLRGPALREQLYRRIMKLNRRRALSAPQPMDPETPLRRAGDLALALDRLPLNEKEALMLVVVARFSYASAATILDIDESELVERLSRARVRLERLRPVANRMHPSYLRVVK